MDYVIGSIGAPIVHFVHGNVGLGFASLGSRLILSPLGALIGLMGACAGTAGRGDCAAAIAGAEDARARARRTGWVLMGSKQARDE